MQMPTSQVYLQTILEQATTLSSWITLSYLQLLLGDNGYPSKTWLIVPYITPITVREASFNTKHSRARVVIERTFAFLKQRFRCLDRSGGVLQYTPQKIASFCVACCVLHNIAMRHGVMLEFDEERVLRDYRRQQAELQVPPPPHNDIVQANAAALRDQLAADLVRRRRR